jgi:hypothetical protein
MCKDNTLAMKDIMSASMMTCLMMAMQTIMSEGTNVKVGFQEDGVGSI